MIKPNPNAISNQHATFREFGIALLEMMKIRDLNSDEVDTLLNEKRGTTAKVILALANGKDHRSALDIIGGLSGVAGIELSIKLQIQVKHED